MRLATLARLDRRLLFGLMFVAVALPFLLPFDLRVEPQPETRRVFLQVEQEQGRWPDDRQGAGPRPVLFSLDYSPDTAPEVEPIAIAMLRQLIALEVPVVLYTAVYENQGVAARLARRLEEEFGLAYGTELVYLGFKPEIRPVIQGIAGDLRSIFPVDHAGTPLDDLPMTAAMQRLADFWFVASIASDDLCLDWIVFGAGRYDVRLVMGCSANLYATVKPYVDSGLIQGVVRGMRGAAEYEELLVRGGIADQTGDGAAGMGSQSGAHLLILALIVLGNVGYLSTRWRRGGR